MTDWQLGLQAFHEGRMREAADRLQAAQNESELTVSQLARYETCAYLGAALYALGRAAEAVTAFELAWKLSPAAVPGDGLIMNLAHAYLATGRRDAAREALRFLLFHYPGHVAASMLAQRLDGTAAGTEVKGAVLGASPETARSYIRTLVFTQPASGGYDPAEVYEALGQLERFVQGLSQELRQAEEKIAQYEMELLRYRQMEDAVVENMVQMQRHSSEGEASAANNALSPIEILFQQKS